MLKKLQNFAKLQKFQLDNLVDFKKCWKTSMCLLTSVPIQPKTSNNLPKILATASAARMRLPEVGKSKGGSVGGGWSARLSCLHRRPLERGSESAFFAKSGRRPSAAACAKKGGIWAHAASAGTGTDPWMRREGFGRLRKAPWKLRKVAAFWKNPEKIWSTFCKNSANARKKNRNFCQNLKSSKFQQFQRKF